MLKIATDLAKVAEFIESRYTKAEIQKMDDQLRMKAVNKNINYITYLRVISMSEELSALAQLVGIYLLYIK